MIRFFHILFMCIIYLSGLEAWGYDDFYSDNIINNQSIQSQPLSNPQDTTINVTETGKWERFGKWFKRKSNGNLDNQPEFNLAQQRIEAGKARIKAIKAREKLNQHLAVCEEKTKNLTAELNQAEEQASLLENQVKFQDAK